MSGRFFLDTNIFIYTFDSKAPAKAKKAVQLIRRAADTGEGIISYQVVQEFFNVALRRFPQPMNAAEAEQYLITVLRPLLAVHSSPAIYLEALRIAEKPDVVVRLTHHRGGSGSPVRAAVQRRPPARTED